MASESYLRRKRKATSERNSIRGKYGNKVKAELRMERGRNLEVVGGCRTYGSLGEHHIELLACDDPAHVWIRVDGHLRCPRTMRGFKSVMSDWFYKKEKEA
jgi:hypothetical protein